MKRTWILVAALVALLVLAASPLFAGGQGASKEEVKKCRVWFWGEDEAVGITDWMKENAALYMKQHPEESWEITHIDIDAIYTGFKAAVEAKDAPELHTAWSGLNTLQFAFTGEIVPVSDYVSKKVTDRIYPAEKQGAYWNGKLWNAALYLDPWYGMLNRKVWKAAGVDSDKFPTEWKEFVAALQKIKAAGYVPWSAGMKDGYYSDFFSSCMQYAYYNSVDEMHQGILGQTSMAKPPHDGWWYAVAELRDKKLLNDDVMSLSLAEGIDRFMKGDVGYSSCVQPQATMARTTLGDDAVDVAICPVPSKAKLAGHLPIPTNPLIMPAVAKYKQEAGKFIEFYLSAERQNALYAKTGVMPATDQVDPALMKNAVDRKTLEWVKTKACFTYQEHLPPSIMESMFAICQEMVGGDIGAKEAAQKFEDAVAKWRKENPKDVEYYKKWAPEAR